MDEAQQIQRAWREAASDLGIEVEPVGDAVLLPQFGGDGGTLCALRRTQDECDDLRRDAEARGAGWSALGHTYLRYDRREFIDALRDWGWSRDAPPPAWYTDSPA